MAAATIALFGCNGVKDIKEQPSKPNQPVFPYVNSGQIMQLTSSYFQNGMGLAAADFDGDGDTDFAFVKVTDGKVMLYKNDGKGNYALAGQIAQLPESYFKHGMGLAGGDFDGDGDTDLAVVKIEDGKVILYKNKSVAEIE